MGKCRAAVVLQRTKQRIGIDLIARATQITVAIIGANVVAVRRDCAEIADNAVSSRSDVEDGVPHGQASSAVIADLDPIIAHSGVEDARSKCAAIVVDAAAVVADRTVINYCIGQGRVVHPTSISADCAVAD